MMGNGKYIVCLICALLWGVLSQGQVLVDDTFAQQHIATDQIDSVAIPQNTSVKDWLQTKNDSALQTPSAKDSYWAYFFTIRNTSTHNITLQLGDAHNATVEEATALKQSSKTPVKLKRGWDFRYFNSWRVGIGKNLWGFTAYMIDINEEEYVTVYFKRSAYAQRANLTLANASYIQEKRAFRNLIQGIYHGIIWILALYHLLIFFTSRQRVYLYFFGYLVLVSAIFFTPYGFFVRWFYEIHPNFIQHYVAFADSFTTVFYFYFVINFLKDKVRNPFFFKYFRKYLRIRLLSVPIFTITAGFDMMLTFQTINILILTELLANTVILVFLARKGDTVIQHFTISNLLLYLGTGIGLVMLLNRVPYSTADVYIQVGIVAQALTLGLGLGAQMRITEQEKQKAQQELILHLEEKQELQQKVNLELEDKVRERTREIESQKEIIELKNKNITDSIGYASLIQSAVLPQTEQLDSLLGQGNYFVFYKPRDVVSGDFFFMEEKQDKMVIAVADCTGHGVPGAFMSMLGITFIKELLAAYDTNFDPATLLNDLRERVKSALHQTGRSGELKDGMDIALCVVDKQSGELEFAGARNPLYIFRKNDNAPELIRIKADKMPIGIYLAEKPFRSQKVRVRKGDRLYMFSDGFLDQINPVTDMCFLRKNFVELLTNLQPNDLPTQGKMLQQAFQDWKGHEGVQTDDVLVMGWEV